MKRLLITAACGLCVLAVGCDEEVLDTLEDKPGVVSVDAPAGKCWTGSIGNSTKEACGSKSFDIEGESIIVANAQKKDPGRWELGLSLEIDGEVVDQGTTDAQFGIVQVSE